MTFESIRFNRFVWVDLPLYLAGLVEWNGKRLTLFHTSNFWCGEPNAYITIKWVTSYPEFCMFPIFVMCTQLVLIFWNKWQEKWEDLCSSCFKITNINNTCLKCNPISRLVLGSLILTTSGVTFFDFFYPPWSLVQEKHWAHHLQNLSFPHFFSAFWSGISYVCSSVMFTFAIKFD